jgi:hypothetical protein
MNVLTKELAKLLKASLKASFPYAKFSVTTHRGLTIDLLDVEFDGEADRNEVFAVAKTFESDSLAVRVSGNSYKLI